MNSEREIVVRIIQPLEHPQPQVQRVVNFSEMEKRGETSASLKQVFLKGLWGVTLIGFLFFFAYSLYQIGLPLKDIVLLMGIPLLFSIIAGYAAF